jgi:hypothetical protein
MEKRPTWAYNWCYFFAAGAVISVLTGFATLTLYKKVSTPILVASLIAALVQGATALTLFYMCRSSLEPVYNNNNGLISRF